MRRSWAEDHDVAIDPSDPLAEGGVSQTSDTDRLDVPPGTRVLTRA
jgi:hypothetical protein